MNAVSQIAFEVALRGEIENNWRAYRKEPNRIQILAAQQTEPSTLPEALRIMAIASFNPLGINLEGKNYRWSTEEGLIISAIKSPQVEEISKDKLWWD